MEKLIDKVRDKKILIAGFGREGLSTYQYIRKHLPVKEIGIADKDGSLPVRHPFLKKDRHLILKTGNSYLDEPGPFDIIFKSPGLKFPPGFRTGAKITSQTTEFLKLFRNQTIGITGTKGKSTTASLIYHILRESNKNNLLLGNIGTAPLSSIEKINSESKIVFELSAHQLEYADVSPGIAILLNLFDEHLDYFQSVEHYHKAKFNIVKYQEKGDFLIFDAEDKKLKQAIEKMQPESNMLSFTVKTGSEKDAYLKNDTIWLDGKKLIYVKELPLKGAHNIKNVMASALACKLSGLSNDEIRHGIESFSPLEHRLEYLGEFKNIHFYNDSIATIPEACIEAVRALKKVDTLILGGFERDLEYSELVEFLYKNHSGNIICYGQAGKRLYQLIGQRDSEFGLFYEEKFNQIGGLIRKLCRPGSVCLLSPAAASYDQFKNFEERGRAYKKIAESL